MTLLQIRPAAPVCFVTSVWLTILPAICSASCGENTSRTPPFNPFLNAPLPRPPAKTCAFNTKLSVCNFSATLLASAPDVATPNLFTKSKTKHFQFSIVLKTKNVKIVDRTYFGVGIPAPFRSSYDICSWTFKCRCCNEAPKIYERECEREKRRRSDQPERIWSFEFRLIIVFICKWFVINRAGTKQYKQMPMTYIVWCRSNQL